MVACPICGQGVDWLTAPAAARLLDVSPQRVRQFIDDGRLPGAVKYRPGGGLSPLWKIPVTSVIALIEARRSS